MTAPPLPGTEAAERAAQAETRLRVQALARERVGRLLLGDASGVGAGAGAVTGAGAGAMALEESYYGSAGGGGSGGGGGAGVDELLALSLYGADGNGAGDGAFDDSLILGRISIEDAPPAPAETIITQPPPVLLGPGPETDLLLASGRVRVETGSAALAASVPLRRVAASALDWRELVPGLRLPEDGAAAASAGGDGLIDAAGSTAGAAGSVGDVAGVGRGTAAAAGFARIELPLLHPGRGVALPGADAPQAAHALRAASAADLAAGPVSLRGDTAFIAQLDAHWARAPWQRAWDDADLESQVSRAIPRQACSALLPLAALPPSLTLTSLRSSAAPPQLRCRAASARVCAFARAAAAGPGENTPHSRPTQAAGGCGATRQASTRAAPSTCLRRCAARASSTPRPCPQLIDPTPRCSLRSPADARRPRRDAASASGPRLWLTEPRRRP